jgi:hypothetical protein
LGPALLRADDDCVRRPRRCWIPQLHPRPGLGPNAWELARTLASRPGASFQGRLELRNLLCSDDGSGVRYYCMYYQRAPTGRWRKWSTWVARQGSKWTLTGKPFLNPT